MFKGGKGKLFSLWTPVVLYIAFIFWLSSAPRPIPGVPDLPWLDKILHAVEFAPLGGLWVRALRSSFPELIGWRLHSAALAASVMVGGMDEFYQRFVPLRFSSGWDLFWDGVGAGWGQWIYTKICAAGR